MGQSVVPTEWVMSLGSFLLWLWVSLEKYRRGGLTWSRSKLASIVLCTVGCLLLVFLGVSPGAQLLWTFYIVGLSLCLWGRAERLRMSVRWVLWIILGCTVYIVELLLHFRPPFSQHAYASYWYLQGYVGSMTISVLIYEYILDLIRNRLAKAS